MEKLFRSFASSIIKSGNLEIELPATGVFRVGDGTGEPLALRFNDKSAVPFLMTDPFLHFGELFMEGRVEVTKGTVYDVLALTGRNLAELGGSAWMRLLGQMRGALRAFAPRNTVRHARENVAHHYDLDRKLYSLFLDADQQYSCAYFETERASLEDAQLAKKRHIASKLFTAPGQRVLDIGCGWGGMALYLARFCGAKVTGITLSQEQLAVAHGRAGELGLDEDVAFRLEDYRNVEGKFDRIVSVGMFEHVGPNYYDAYFKKVAALLEDDGVGLIHTIGRAGGPWPTNPWVAKYIFPGGYIPSLSEIMPSVEKAGLYLTDVEILRLHYAETLQAWRERFNARRADARELYDERFCRMWEFYLAGAEASFRYEGNVVFQLQVAKRIDALPLTRTYIEQREAELRRRDAPAPALRIAGE